ncbi:MAG: Bug family tripartite tricarboxylate transporter substrate binding protein [Hyphomicrobiaceae bacterium]
MAPVSVAAAADYFHGKTITVTVPAGSGGTYHVYCLLISAHLGRHIPGNPTLIVNNRPGGGGATAAAYMASVAPKDGTAIAMMAPGSITAPLAHPLPYKATEFKWLGSAAARSSAIWVWHTKKISTLDQLKTQEVTIGSTGYGAGGSIMPRLINEAFGTKMKIVYGYKSGGSINIAIERSEVDGRWNYPNGFEGVRPTWLPEKKIIPIIAMGPRDAKRLPGVPHIDDLLKKGTRLWRLKELIDLDYQVGQAFYAPPDTPDNVMKILRTAFVNMVKDPVTQQDFDKRRIELSPISAEKISNMVKSTLTSVTGDDIKMFKDIYLDKSKVANKGKKK